MLQVWLKDSINTVVAADFIESNVRASLQVWLEGLEESVAVAAAGVTVMSLKVGLEDSIEVAAATEVEVTVSPQVGPEALEESIAVSIEAVDVVLLQV